MKDLVDLVLLANLAVDIKANKLHESIVLVFEKRGDHMPDSFHSFPSDWRQRYNRQAEEIDLDIIEYQEAEKAISSFISPVMSGSVAGLTWNSIAWKWGK